MMAATPRKDAARDEFEVWSSPVLANMLWVLLSTFIITMPLAMVGLMGFMYHWVMDRDTRVFARFFGTIRRVWLKCYLLLALDIAVGGLLYFNFLMFQVMDMNDIMAFLSRSLTVFVTVFLILFNVHAWVLISVWDASFRRIISFTLRLVLAQPLWSIAIAVTTIFPFVVAQNMPVAVFIVAIGAIAAGVACRGTHFLVKKYLTSDQFQLIDIP